MLYVLSAALLLAACQKAPEPHVVREMNCNGGDMDACHQIGMERFSQARPDIGGARQMFAKACRWHHPPSCNMLAQMVRDARGGPRDVKRAAELFEIACKGEVADACVELAVFYFDGVGVKEDRDKAVQLFRAACQDDPMQPKACSALAVAYEMQEGLGEEEEDLKKDEAMVMAEELHDKACEATYAPGCVSVGRMNTEKRAYGDEKEANLQKAADYYEKACSLDAKFGCYELADLHEKGDAPDASDDKAAVFYQKTCNIDPTRGCFEAAALMESGKVSAREGEIESLYNLACEHGHTEACSKRSIDLQKEE